MMTNPSREVLLEEARFILANIMAEGRYGQQNRLADIQQLCDNAVTIPFTQYIGFLSTAGYLTHDRSNDMVDITDKGQKIVTGGPLDELMNSAAKHFQDGDNMRSATKPPPFRKSKSAGDSPSRKASGELGARGGGSRYVKEDAIGTGGIGTVYRARQRTLDRLVALKEIRELFGLFAEDQRGELSRRFGEVVQAMANLSHPNILPVHDAVLDSDYPYLVTELMEQGSLRRLIADAEEIPMGLIVSYIVQTLHALRTAHSQGVFHRGLKPENLLLDGAGNLKVSDFGMARIVERDKKVIQQAFVGMGSVAYMAPESFQPGAAADAQADIYALGIIFYELLARRVPGRRSPMPSDVDSRCPKGMDDIFDRMTHDDRAERYKSVGDVLADLKKVAGIEQLLQGASSPLSVDNVIDGIKFRESVTDEKPLVVSDKEIEEGFVEEPGEPTAVTGK